MAVKFITLQIHWYFPSGYWPTWMWLWENILLNFLFFQFDIYFHPHLISSFSLQGKPEVHEVVVSTSWIICLILFFFNLSWRLIKYLQHNASYRIHVWTQTCTQPRSDKWCMTKNCGQIWSDWTNNSSIFTNTCLESTMTPKLKKVWIQEVHLKRFNHIFCSHWLETQGACVSLNGTLKQRNVHLLRAGRSRWDWGVSSS